MRCLVGLILGSVCVLAQGGASFRWIQRVGPGKDTLVGLGTDAAGNAYIVGNTQTARLRDVFVVKLDGAGNVVYTTTVGGSGDDYAQAATVDAAGNVYVVGTTLSTDFPATEGAYRTTPPPAGPFQLRGATFVFKLDAGGRVGYATYFSTPESVPRAIAVDGAGSAHVTGSTQGGLPVTPGAYRTTCNCGLFSNGFFATPQLDGFVARFDTAGSKLVYATYA